MLEWLSGWRVVADSFSLRVEGPGVSEDALLEHLARMTPAELWADAATSRAAGAVRGRNDLSKGVRSMSKTKKSQVMDGESAYAALKTRAEGLSLDVVGTTRGVNLDDAASRILGVVAMLESEPAIVLRLQSLPATELDPRHLEELRPMALALSWAAQHVKSEQAVASNALVPSHVIEVGYAIRARMLELVSYHLRRIPSCWAEIVPLRQAGTGRPRRLNTDASGGEVVNTTAPITTPAPGSSAAPA